MLMNNIGALNHTQGAHEEAAKRYNAALELLRSRRELRGLGDWEATLLYNVARLHEDLGEVGQARALYQRLVEKHPRYSDGKSIRRVF